MKALTIAAIFAAAISANTQTVAAPFVLTFEGLQNLEAVGGFYNGGTGGDGSVGTNYGVEFVGGSLALIDADAGGTGNFANETSPDTVLFFLTTNAVLNYAAGFQDGFSFTYSAINYASVVNVYDDLNATGNLLASITLPIIPTQGNGDPTGAYDFFQAVGVQFSGTAKSIDFGGTANQVVFDNITFGSDTPIISTPVPEPESYAMMLAGLGLMGFAARRRKI